MAHIFHLFWVSVVMLVAPLVALEDSNATAICPKDCMNGPVSNHFECVDSECVAFPTELIEDPESVEVVDVSFNLISDLPEMSHPVLTFLDLSHNHITEINENAFVGCPKLQYLNLSVNRLTQISLDNTWYLDRMIVLNLSDNRISKIDENVFRRMDSMVHLDLSKNRIDTLSINTFFGLDELEILDLSVNELTTIEGTSLLGLTRLQYLSLRRNKLSFIQKDAFRDVRDSLLRLDLGENQLINISSDMFHPGASHPFSKIQALHLDNNLIKYIPGKTFSPIKSLQYIFLERNPIHSISSERQFPENLKNISLRENKKLSIITNGTFSGLKHLESVDISGCYRLSTIEAGAFDAQDSTLTEFKAGQAGLGTLSHNLLNWTRVENIDLAGNPWICDCNLQWMQTTLSHDVVKTVKCTYPHHLKGQSLDNLEPDLLECSFFSKYRHRMGIALILAATTVFIIASTYLLITYQKRVFAPCRKLKKGDYQTLYTAEDRADPAVSIQWDEMESENAPLKTNPAPTPV